MRVRVYTMDVGDVKDVYRKECGVVRGLEDGIEDWIKRDMGVLN